MLKSLGIGLAILAIYLAFLTRAHYWDGVLFSWYVERVSANEMSRSVLFHPNHLIYSAAGFVLYDAFSAFHLRALTCFQIINAACGAATAMLIHKITLRLTGSAKLAVACTILLALGATWWKFSTDGGAYVPATLLVLLAVRAAWAGRTVETSLFHFASLMFHELAIFAALPIFFALAVRSRIKAGVYCAITVGLTLSGYATIFQISKPHVQQNLVAWVTSFSHEAKMTHSFSQVFANYPLSYAKLIVGGKFSLVRDFFSTPVLLALLTAVGLLITATWLFLRPPDNNTAMQPVNRMVKVTLWLWVLPYALFLVWWEPGNAFYKLFCWPAIVMLIGIAFAEHLWMRQRAPALLALICAIAAWNFGAFIYPHTMPDSDPVYALSLRLNRELPKDVKVFYKVFSPDDWYLAYFAPGHDWQALPGTNLANQVPLCLETTALSDDQVDLSQLEKQKTWTLLDNKHHVQVSCFLRNSSSPGN